MPVNDYEKQALDFLQRHGITCKVMPLGFACPRFCEDAQSGFSMDEVTSYPRDTHTHGKHYRFFLRRNSTGVHAFFDYWSSYYDEANAEKTGKEHIPTAYDLLSVFTKGDPGTFAEFCHEYSYDTDSIKGLETYKAVMEEWDKVRRLFTDEELTELQEIQ